LLSILPSPPLPSQRDGMFIEKSRIIDNLPSQSDGMFIEKSRIIDNLPSQRDGMFIEMLFTKEQLFSILMH